MSQLMLRRCQSCGHVTALPLSGCAVCGSADLIAAEASQFGSLYTWTTSYHVFDPDNGSDTPYTVGLVVLDGGGRVPGRIVGVDVDRLRDGLRLKLSTGSNPAAIEFVEEAG